MATGYPIQDGRKVVASSATAERLVSTPSLCSQVLIQAETDNTGVILVGGSATLDHAATARTGAVLTAGNSITLPVKELYDVYILASVNGDGVTFVYLNE